jgi:hypothetical protein
MRELTLEEIRDKSILLQIERDRLTEQFKQKVEEALSLQAEINSIKDKVNAKVKEIDDFFFEHRHIINQ